jgi:cysteine-S-conjugate beta-lyase
VGRVFSRAELEHLAEICLRNDIIICSDEIHCDLVYFGYRHLPIASLSAELAKRTITLMAPSKTFNIPGLNLSFVVVQNPHFRAQLNKARRGVVGLPNLLACAATRGAYQHGESWLEALLVYLDSNRRFLIDFIRGKTPIITIFEPQGTYLAWLDFRQLNFPVSASTFFLQQAKVALNDGRDFGAVGEGFARLNFGCPRFILHKALGRMANTLNSL